MKNGWNNPAITNYGGVTFRNCDIARNIARLHLLLEQCGIKKGENVMEIKYIAKNIVMCYNIYARLTE